MRFDVPDPPGEQRQPRVDYRAATPPRGGALWVVCACVFLTACLSGVVVFLSRSDLTLSSGDTPAGTPAGTPGGTPGGTPVGTPRGPECDTDADCVSCCAHATTPAV